MRKPSASGKFVRMSADEIPARTPRDMARLKAAMNIPVEPSEDLEPSQLVGPEVRRDASGRIVKRPLGLLRAAILAALDRHQMTRYAFWKKAHARCESLSASAVYEYLRGDREIGSEYLEALIEAASLKVVNQGRSEAKTPADVPRIEETLKRIPQSAPLLKKRGSRQSLQFSNTVLGPSGASKDSGGGKPLPPARKAASKLLRTAKKQVSLKVSRSQKSAKARKK